MKNLNNLTPFYVGQKVVYIKDREMPKGTICTVTNFVKDECGCFCMEINNISIEKTQGLSKCNGCNRIYNYSLKNDYDFNDFQPLIKSIFPSLTMKEVVKKEQVLISMN